MLQAEDDKAVDSERLCCDVHEALRGDGQPDIIESYATYNAPLLAVRVHYNLESTSAGTRGASGVKKYMK